MIPLFFYFYIFIFICFIFLLHISASRHPSSPLPPHQPHQPHRPTNQHHHQPRKKWPRAKSSSTPTRGASPSVCPSPNCRKTLTRAQRGRRPRDAAGAVCVRGRARGAADLAHVRQHRSREVGVSVSCPAAADACVCVCSCLRNTVSMFHVLEEERKWRVANNRPPAFCSLAAFPPVVAVGADRPLEEQLLVPDYFHGRDGLGGVHTLVPPPPPPPSLARPPARQLQY